MMQPVTRKLGGWGNYPVQECRVFRPERVRDLGDLLGAGEPEAVASEAEARAAARGGYISRGLGRSYGDAALNAGGGVVLHERLNRLLSFDESSGVVGCEGGATFADLLDAFLPRGWFPPVTPGTKFVTVGGALAADVHGKNHHRDGSLGSFVEDFDLLTGTGAVLRCSREHNADAFRATLGGMGLTGAVLSARLKLRRVESAYCTVHYRKAGNLDAALELFATDDFRYRYSVAWIDCLASGASLGRSVLMRGDHTPAADLPEPARADPLRPPPRRAKGVPFNFPGFVLNPLTVKAFNARFYRKHVDGAEKVVRYDDFFYPLDAVSHWNRVYGRRGFLQYQVVLPPEAGRAGLVELLERLSASRRASFLAVLKSFGPQGEGMLSFPRPGFTLALDLPNTGPDLVEFLRGLDAVVLKHGGRVYLAKDACLTREAFEAMYPDAAGFKQVKRRLDPEGRFTSSQARRLGLAGADGPAGREGPAA